jgi:hypothetical protein
VKEEPNEWRTTFLQEFESGILWQMDLRATSSLGAFVAKRYSKTVLKNRIQTLL